MDATTGELLQKINIPDAISFWMVLVLSGCAIAMVNIETNEKLNRYRATMAFNEDAIASSQEAIAEYKEALRIDPHQNFARSRLLELGQKTVGTNLSEVANEDSTLSEVKSKYIKKVYAKVYSNWKTKRNIWCL